MEEAIVISPLEEQMEQSLVKANVTDKVIASFKEKYGSLRLKDVDDKEGYLEIKDAKKDCAKLRNLTVKICKEGRDEAVKVQKKWVAKEKEVVDKIKEVESPLDAEIDRYEANQARLKEEEKQRQEAIYMQRTQVLTKMGAAYMDNSFILGEFSLESALVKESSEDVWKDEILPKFNEQFLVIEQERIEMERIKTEYEAELKRQQEELEKKQREFEEQQAKFKEEQQKIEREAQEKKRIIINKRSALLSQLGLKYDGNKYLYEGINVYNTDVSTLSDDEFTELIDKIKPVIEEKEAEYAQKQQELIEQQKKDAAEAAAQRERERIEQERLAAEEKRKQEELRKAEELAKAGDKAIWADFIDKLSKIEVPALKSGQYRKIANISKEKIEEILSLKP